MRAEIITIQSQPVNKQKTDRSQTFLIKELERLGISIHESILLKKNSKQLFKAFERTRTKADLIFVRDASSTTADKFMQKTMVEYLNDSVEQVLIGLPYTDEHTTYILLPQTEVDLTFLFNQHTRLFIIEQLFIPQLSGQVKKLLKKQGKKITAAESLTAGSFLKAISGESGASEIFEGGIVTYSNSVKHQVLGVSQATIDTHGVVSAECAIEMAEKSMQMFEADLSISLTGAAGPSSLEGKEPGTVWIGLAQTGKKTFAKKYHFQTNREENRQASVLSALNLVNLTLLDKPIPNQVF